METLTDDRMNIPLDESDELYHHGIKGMKWGVRRYQTKDGSLTPRGLKRYSKDMEKLQKEERRLANERATKAKLDKLDNARKRIEEQKAELKKKPGDNEEPKKKTLSEMSNEEVAAYKQRIQNEKDIAEAEAKIAKAKMELASYTPKEKTAIEKFTDGIGGKIVKQVWDDVGKKQINDFLSKNLDMEKPLDELGKLKKEANIWKEKENIAKSKKNYGDDTEKYENAQRRRAKEESIRKNNEESLNRAEKKAYEEDEARTKAKEEAYAKAKKQVDDYNTPWEEREGTYRKKGSDLKWNKDPINRDGSDRLRLEQIDRYEATGKDVIGKGTSKFSGWNDPPTRDAIWDGQRYVDSLLMLEDKRMKHTMDLDNESYDALMHYGIKGMKWGVHRFYNKDGSRTAAGKKRENEAKRGKNQNGDDYEGDPETRPDLYYKSSKSSFAEALKDYVPSKNRYGFVNDLEISKDVGNNKKVNISVYSAAKDSNVDFASIDEMKSRTKKADEFIKQFNDDDMRNYLADSYHEYAFEPISREQFKKQFELASVRINPDWNTYEATYIDDGVMNDHMFTIEGDMKTRKPIRSSMDG